MMTREIMLNTGVVALVDDDDFEWLSRHKWQESHNGYAVRSTRIDGVKRKLQMHRVVLAGPSGLQVDHIDGNRLNNQRHNLRLLTNQQNKQNSHGARRDSRLGVRNIRFRPDRPSPYQVFITVAGKRIYLGSYANLEDADRAASEGRSRYFQQVAS